MAKKFRKFLLFTTVAGAAAAGVYLYLKQKNENSTKDYEDSDDDISDFFDDDKKSDSERGYVSLDRGASVSEDTSSTDTVEADKPDDDPQDE